MGRPRKVFRTLPPFIEGEPPSEPPYLNSTASYYMGDAWHLFAEISQRCDIATAKFIFGKCIKEAERQENQEQEIAREAARRKHRHVELPSAAKINEMDYGKVCLWWRRLEDSDQTFENDGEKASLAALALRYQNGKGYQGARPPAPPPIKQQGAKRRVLPKAAELPAVFDALKAKHPTFDKMRLAEIVFAGPNGAAYGKSVEAINRAEREWRKKNRKV